jgi:hypothetical protein
VNVTTNASATIAPMAADRKPRPAAGDTGAWEDPDVTGVTPGGSASEVGEVGI